MAVVFMSAVLFVALWIFRPESAGEAAVRQNRYLAAHDTTHMMLDSLRLDMDSVKWWTRP